ncbi:hypothetical protein DRN74_02430 [Candidatus Micrarchaeota archaeon]|nr:MAG: hypothetical protein DRN74_02430 [Candidatus Micrarchaeota archaeon]
MKGDRVSSGIFGLDDLVAGGFPKNSIILLAGGPGTGKTTFSLQYLYKGIVDYGENAIYVSSEEDFNEINTSMSAFGMDFEKVSNEKKFSMITFEGSTEIKELISRIKNSAKQIKANRLVIDSFSSLELFASTYKSVINELPLSALRLPSSVMVPTEAIVRKMLYKLISSLKQLGLTTILTSEFDGSTKYSRYGVAEFLVDGLIVLHYSSIGQKKFGNIEIKKLRKTKHTHGIFDYDLTEKGFEIFVEHGPSIIMK